MKDLEEFEKDICKNCKNKNETDMCEIIRSRIDGSLHCKNYEKEIDNK